MFEAAQKYNLKTCGDKGNVNLKKQWLAAQIAEDMLDFGIAVGSHRLAVIANYFI